LIYIGLKVDPSPAFVAAYLLVGLSVAGLAQWVRICWGDQENELERRPRRITLAP